MDQPLFRRSRPRKRWALGLSPGAAVFRFRRIHLADDEPTAYEQTAIVGGCLPSLGAVEESLYEALARFGSRPVRVQRLRAVAFLGEHARMLGVDPGHARLLIERRGFLRDRRPVEFTQSYIAATPMILSRNWATVRRGIAEKADFRDRAVPVRAIARGACLIAGEGMGLQLEPIFDRHRYDPSVMEAGACGADAGPGAYSIGRCLSLELLPF